MDQVIVFDKSLQQRLNEYIEILGYQEVLPVSALKDVWAYYLELSLDPNGWQAVWKIPRSTCEVLKIPFPTIVLVYVESVDYSALTAKVKIIAVQDEESLPDKHLVPLTNLWLMKEQDKTVALNIESSANSLDLLRFFYNNVFMPWDYEEDDTLDWVSRHLESRLRLFYDIKNGVIPRRTSEYIHALIVEARTKQTTKEQIESELDCTSEDELDINNGNFKDKRLEKLMDLHVRIIQIRAEIDILENPLMRAVIMKRQEESMLIKDNQPKKFWMILDGGKVDDFMNFLSQVKQYHPNEILNFAPDLKMVNRHDTVILSNRTHTLKTIGGLEEGGILKGIYDKEDTIVCTAKDDVMFDFSGEVLLENMTINAALSQCVVLVRGGKVTLRNCNLVGDGVSSTHQGIIVLNGNELVLKDCDITGFSIAVVGNSGSTITMSNCKVHGVTFGMKLFEGSRVSVENCEFSECLDYAFCVDVGDREHSTTGSFDVLQLATGVKFQGLKGHGNGKGDVKINHKHRIKPIHDLFAASESASEEEMEFSSDLNNTVVENLVA